MLIWKYICKEKILHYFLYKIIKVIKVIKRCHKIEWIIYVTWKSMFKQLKDVDKLRKHDWRCTIAWNYLTLSNKYNIIIKTAHFTFKNLRKLCKEKRCYTSSQIVIKSSIKFILRRNWYAEIDIYLLILCQKLILLSVLLKNSINISSPKMCWEEWPGLMHPDSTYSIYAHE